MLGKVGSLALGLVIAGAVACGSALAVDLKTVTKKGKFEDVKADVSDAIINRGLTIDYNGNLGRMLDRTGADVGSTKPVYANAEFFTFCSAKLSRAMMEADPLNIAYCPYVVFVFEQAGKPGEITIGYRAPDPRGNDASKKALADIAALLDGVLKDAAK